jgi:hypothetical protein
MEINTETLYVNLFGGPGISKSTSATNIFAELKWRGIRSEYVSEYAKQVIWENNLDKLNHQIFLSGMQLYNQAVLNGKVKVVVTDSPILLGIIYDEGRTPFLKPMLLHQFNTFNNYNILFQREKKYDPIGRVQTEEQAKEKDREIEELLIDNKIGYNVFPGNKDSIKLIVDKIIEKL